MRVAIIGGTGLVGRNVAAALEGAGHQVVIAARRDVGEREREATRPFRAIDVMQAATLEAALDGCDAAVSCFDALRQTEEATFHDVHVRGVGNLLSACRARKVRRLVHLSSLSARPSSKSAFHRTKFAGEELVRRATVEFTVLRPSVIFGPGHDFVNPLARLLRKIPVAPLPGAGTALLQPIAVTDVALAIARALAEPARAVGKRFDLCGPEPLTIAEVYDRVLGGMGIRRPRVRVPYLVIEPLTHFFGTFPGAHFSFDQLAILEEERPGDPSPAVEALGLRLEAFTAESVRRALLPPGDLAEPWQVASRR